MRDRRELLSESRVCSGALPYIGLLLIGSIDYLAYDLWDGMNAFGRHMTIGINITYVGFAIMYAFNRIKMQIPSNIGGLMAVAGSLMMLYTVATAGI
jgi:hypothetical protein